MELTFEKINNKYISEFEITTDCNLHLEKKTAGPIKLYQRTVGGGYDLINDVKNVSGVVDDVDLVALVYPKTIKIESSVEPTYAALTTSGEVTEIKSQSKVVEVTSNGTTAVTPDAGYSYLSKVDVKTNVATEGGGSAMEYLDLTGEATQGYAVVTIFSFLAVVSGGVRYVVAPTSYLILNELINNTTLPKYVAIDFSAKVDMGGIKSVRDVLLEMGASADALAAIPRITKEEFYSFNTPV